MNINISETAVDLLLNIINIVILFFVVKALVYKPVHKFLSERTERINGEMEKAEKLKAEAQDVLSERDNILNESRKLGEKEAQKTVFEAQKASESIIDDARQTAKLIKEKSEREIKTEKENMIASSKDEIASLAVEIAERILRREVSKTDNERIVEEFFTEEKL